MNKNLKASETITINANAEVVWDVLTNPDRIKQYLYGTETITDWKVGNDITFQGAYEGQTYKDKGVVLENEPNIKLVYNYWSGFSGLPDTPENYSKVSYLIKPITHNQVEFTWVQEGFANETGQQHSQEGLKTLLLSIKKIAEEIPAQL